MELQRQVGRDECADDDRLYRLSPVASAASARPNPPAEPEEEEVHRSTWHISIGYGLSPIHVAHFYWLSWP